MTDAATGGDGRAVLAAPSRRVRLLRFHPTFDPTAPTQRYVDEHRAFDRLTWTGERTASDFDIGSVVASWQASTPGETWVEVAVRGGPTAADGPWLLLARWADSDQAIRRTTVAGQDTDAYRVAADEITIAAGRRWRHLQTRVTLARPSDSAEPWPSVDALHVLTSTAPAGASAVDSPPSGVAHVLDVPPHSQQLYRDHDPELDGGGQSWCSPTAVTMVLEYWGVRLPEPAVPYAARHTYDVAYGGCGNWAFNTAFAARFGLTAFVTRLRSLAEAELFTRAGIPLVLGVRFRADQLDGAGYDTNGHLLVLVGFDEHGDPVVNDPASHHVRSDDEVRTTYRRDQFLSSWQERGTGIAYVIRPPAHRLPPVPDEANW